MNRIDRSKSRMLKDGAGLVTPKNLALQCLIFFAFFFICMMVESMPASMIAVPRITMQMLKLANTNFVELMEFSKNIQLNQTEMLVSLFSTALAIVLTFAFCHDVEHRPIRSLGFRRERSLRDYLIGAGIGVGMIGAVILLCVLSGAFSYSGMNIKGQLGAFFLFCLAWMIQGMSEEIVFRGYLCNTIAQRHSLPTAILVSAAAFALAHGGNPGQTLLALPNILLFGVFASLYMYRFDSLWGIGALHAFWNMAQGTLFGVEVSGVKQSVALFTFSRTGTGDILCGGSFGLEGGLFVTLVFTIGIVLLLFVPQKEKA